MYTPVESTTTTRRPLRRARQSVEIDLDTVHRLKAQGIPTPEIARQLKVPVSTLKDHLKRPLPEKATDVYKSGTTKVYKGGAANVHIDIPLSDLADFQEESLHGGASGNISSAPRMSHLPRPSAGHCTLKSPSLRRLKAEAEAEHVTVTEIINRIIRHYYER